MAEVRTLEDFVVIYLVLGLPLFVFAFLIAWVVTRIEDFMAQDSYSLGLLKQGYRTARKYLMGNGDNEDGPAKNLQRGNLGQAASPGKTRAQIASEEAAANRGTEAMTPVEKHGSSGGRGPQTFRRTYRSPVANGGLQSPIGQSPLARRRKRVGMAATAGKDVSTGGLQP